ncbi:nickel pincer cofactor biosynthesis protein LarC, partial [Candidatus Aerophobetes bacterium]|nr:nickel pincer cofactor biosynthesis protein LarC [Candidatus Aerophobetes bacterium]
AKVHQESIENLHFHELGSLDTLIDVVCSVAGIDALKVEKIYASAVNLGGGTVNTSHGILPVPAPATLEILRNVPVYSSTSSSELTTPTGAAILKVFSSGYGNIPLMRVEKVGYGAGEKELSFPNVLRILIGEMESSLEEDEVSVIETNIDDMNPQFYGYVAELLFEKGALDVFLTPVYMKKNRPGVVLTVICEKKDEARFLEMIFRETTTLGVRVYHAKRRKLKRETRIIKTSLGEVKVKLGILNGKIVNFSPEYEDCKKIASSRSLPLKEVYQVLRKELSF